MDVNTIEPALARMTGENTPLFWLPDDDARAMTLVELLLAHGADVAFTRKQDGLTAADVARSRAMDEIAARLERAAIAGPGGGQP
jgi:hypothetical protein